MGGLTESILGSNKNIAQTQAGTQQTNFNPADIASIRGQQATVQGQTGQYSNFANQLAQQGMGNVNGIQTNFNAQPGGLDAYGQQMLSKQLGINQAGQQAQQRQIASSFQNNPALAKILGAQSMGQSQLANNPLAFMASQEQLGRQQNAQQLGNQAQLQQLGGLGSVLGLSGQGLQAQNNLLGTLSQLGQQFGQQVSNSNSNQDVTSGGLIGKLTGGLGGLGNKGGGF